MVQSGAVRLTAADNDVTGIHTACSVILTAHRGVDDPLVGHGAVDGDTPDLAGVVLEGEEEAVGGRVGGAPEGCGRAALRGRVCQVAELAHDGEGAGGAVPAQEEGGEVLDADGPQVTAAGAGDVGPVADGVAAGAGEYRAIDQGAVAGRAGVKVVLIKVGAARRDPVLAVLVDVARVEQAAGRARELVDGGDVLRGAVGEDADDLEVVRRVSALAHGVEVVLSGIIAHGVDGAG